MLFNTPSYLVFFTAVLLVYWLIPSHRPRLAWLLFASWVFYAAWYPLYLILFVVMIAWNYLGGVGVARYREKRPGWSKCILAATIIGDLGNLAMFKYLDFFVQSATGVWGFLSGRSVDVPLFNLVLPLGISFYTFQLMGYVIDVYRGQYPVVRNPFKIALFKAFFPQLIAGPILRAHQFIWQLDSKREFQVARLMHGLDLIAFGLFKKVLIADQLCPFVNKIFAAPEGHGSLTLLLAVYAYAAQIYCDFSGYTDIGRGRAYCLGYELPINFNMPYLSCNITEFWRRWHITLSNWLRDYLYIPLGGNRASKTRTYLNLLITMVLGGLWHGASWCFVIWGAIHGVTLAITRLVHELAGVKPAQPLFGGRVYRVFAIFVTFHLVCLGWVFFRATTFAGALAVLWGIGKMKFITSTDTAVTGYVTLGLVGALLVVAALLHLLVGWARRKGVQNRLAWALARPVMFALVAIGVLLFAGRGAQQFIYFQF